MVFRDDRQRGRRYGLGKEQETGRGRLSRPGVRAQKPLMTSPLVGEVAARGSVRRVRGRPCALTQEKQLARCGKGVTLELLAELPRERSGRSPTLQKAACSSPWRDDLRVVRGTSARGFLVSFTSQGVHPVVELKSHSGPQSIPPDLVSPCRFHLVCARCLACCPFRAFVASLRRLGCAIENSNLCLTH